MLSFGTADIDEILITKDQAALTLTRTEAAEDYPKVWTSVEVEYIVTGRDIDPKAVERAMQLSAERYCPAQNMLNKAVQIDLSYKIVEAEG